MISVYNVLAGKEDFAVPDALQYYSVGLHPWFIDEKMLVHQLEEVGRLVAGEMCVAIGETGLDRLTKPPMTLQQTVFERQLAMAGMVGKPVIVHNVKAHAEIMALYKKAKVLVPLIFHGFNNNRQIAGHLLKEGFYFSFGKALLNPKSNAAQMLPTFPSDRFFLETDDAEIAIEVVYQKAAELCNLGVDELKAIINRNFKNCFGKWE